jgi:hypothetical protein
LEVEEFFSTVGMTAMLVLRYTIAETSCVPIIRVLIILDTQCVLFKYPHKAKTVVCLKPVRFVDEV